MSIGIYQSAAALDAQEIWNQNILQNMAGSQVPGYCAVETGIQGKSMGKVPGTTGTGSSFGKMLDAVSPVAVSKFNYSPGAAVKSGSDMDLALMDRGFFEYQGAGGNRLYSRNGRLHINADGMLVNSRGMELIGNGGPIQLQPGQGKLRVDAEGNVYQGTVQINKIAVYDLKDEMQDQGDLIRVQDGFMSVDGKAQAEPITTPILQGSYEGSNVSQIRAMGDLVVMSRIHEANTQYLKTIDQQYSQLIQATARQ